MPTKRAGHSECGARLFSLTRGRVSSALDLCLHGRQKARPDLELVVIDNSVVAGWYLEDQANPYTEHVAARLQDDRAIAPAVWELELTNVLRTSCLRRRLTADKAQRVLAQIALLPIDVDRHAVPRVELLALA